MANTICWIQHTKSEKYGKVLYKPMNNAVYRKRIENFKKRIDAKLASDKKDYLKWASKPTIYHTKYMTMI